MSAACKTCVFYSEGVNGESFTPRGLEVGECRRSLPRANVDYEGQWQYMRAFPIVYQDDWCAYHNTEVGR